MDYRKENNGELVISNAAEGEQAVIDAIIAVLDAYKANLSEKPEGEEPLEFTGELCTVFFEDKEMYVDAPFNMPGFCIPWGEKYLLFKKNKLYMTKRAMQLCYLKLRTAYTYKLTAIEEKAEYPVLSPVNVLARREETVLGFFQSFASDGGKIDIGGSSLGHFRVGKYGELISDD